MRLVWIDEILETHLLSESVLLVFSNAGTTTMGFLGSVVGMFGVRGASQTSQQLRSTRLAKVQRLHDQVEFEGEVELLLLMLLFGG